MNADIRVENGKLVYGLEECTCMGGKVHGYKKCPTCHGTGKTKGGLGKGDCRKCLGGRVVDFDTKVDCSRCKGTYKVQSDSTSYLPKGITGAIPLKVYRSTRPQSWNEAYLGFGCVYSVTDYGRHKDLTDEELVSKVREEMSKSLTQGCKISKRDTGELCDHIGIYTNNNGYTLMAVFRGE